MIAVARGTLFSDCLSIPPYHSCYVTVPISLVNTGRSLSKLSSCVINLDYFIEQLQQSLAFVWECVCVVRLWPSLVILFSRGTPHIIFLNLSSSAAPFSLPLSKMSLCFSLRHLLAPLRRSVPFLKSVRVMKHQPAQVSRRTFKAQLKTHHCTTAFSL